MVLLLVAFRSAIVLLQAALVNLLAVGAAYGLLTAVFQEGNGAAAIGLDGAIPIVSYVPMMMFAILFGLAMDYQVFLQPRARGDRCREVAAPGGRRRARRHGQGHRLGGGDHGGRLRQLHPERRSDREGVRRRAGFRILIAGTMVRVLLPADMLLKGKRTWRLPRRLDRVPAAHQRGGRAARGARRRRPGACLSVAHQPRPARGPPRPRAPIPTNPRARGAGLPAHPTRPRRSPDVPRPDHERGGPRVRRPHNDCLGRRRGRAGAHPRGCRR